MVRLKETLEKEILGFEDLVYLLGLQEREDLEALYRRAYDVKSTHVGRKVFYRGLIEFSNICRKDCHYCGIRAGNRNAHRFEMSFDEAVAAAKWCYEANYGSVVIQAGERSDEAFLSTIEKIIREIKEMTKGELGITLSLGEQSEDTYRRWFEAGAHRYLLRIETSSRKLYEQIHPANAAHSFDERVECLNRLRRVGYQVGTGVMIGFPGQTVEDLANDILFFRDHDIDMIGMGPYVVHSDTPMGVVAEDSEAVQRWRFELGLKAIAVTRILLKDVNIAAATALQALNPLGRELALKAGANIIMPNITDTKYRKEYLLYNGKPCVDDSPDHCRNCLRMRIESVGDVVAEGEWGDSPHFRRRRKAAEPG